MARNDPHGYRADDPEWQGIMALTGEERLEAYVKHLNGFSHARGRPYFVAARQKPDGTTERVVEQAP